MILRSLAVAVTMLTMLGCSESDGGVLVRLAHFDPALVEGLSDAERVALGERLSAAGSWGDQEMTEFNSLVFGPPGSTEAACCVPTMGVAPLSPMGCDLNWSLQHFSLFETTGVKADEAGRIAVAARVVSVSQRLAGVDQLAGADIEHRLVARTQNN